MSFMLKGTKNKKKKGKAAWIQILSSFTKMNQIQSCPQGSHGPEWRPRQYDFLLQQERENLGGFEK